MGDLNLNKLRLGDKEGKILCDLKKVYGLGCLIKEPTKITEDSSTLLWDVILTNKQECFGESAVFNPEISDHHMVYGSQKERAVAIRTLMRISSMKIWKWPLGMWGKFWNLYMISMSIGKYYSIISWMITYLPGTWEWGHIMYHVCRESGWKLKDVFRKTFNKNPTSENFEMKRKWRNEATKQRKTAIR